MSESPELIVQRQLDAYNRRDLEAILAIYADDAEFIEHPSTVLCRGRAALRERFTARFAEPDLHARLVQRIVLGAKVFDHEEITRNIDAEVRVLSVVMLYKGALAASPERGASTAFELALRVYHWRHESEVSRQAVTVSTQSAVAGMDANAESASDYHPIRHHDAT